MKLSEALKNVKVVGGLSDKEKNIEVSSVFYDSRKATSGGLFVCISGALSDGHNYAHAAYERGCRVFVAEREIALDGDATVIFTDNSRIALAEISQEFFGHPSKKLKVIGITGTKGKTTVANMIYHVLNKSGLKTGYIGTNGVLFDTKHIETENTTPESYDLAKYMSDMLDSGVKYLVLEVSSQALYLNRVHSMSFEICIFTNLSPDHIGEREHPSFEHYRDCKKKLFSDFSPKTVIYNEDDDFSQYMIQDFKGEEKIAFSTCSKDASFSADSIELFRNGSRLGVKFDMKVGKITQSVELSMAGEYNVSNALAATAACMCAGVCLPDIIREISGAVIKGRFEIVDALPYATFIIDYAHNGLGLTKVLQTLRAYSPRRLICLFGSVGGRTKMRRKELGAVASSLADFCIITSDNPDNEPIQDIIDDIVKGFDENENACPYIEIPSRREAVLYAVKMAQKGDIVLFAGKGHESFQLISGKKEYFCERETIVEGAFGMLLGR